MGRYFFIQMCTYELCAKGSLFFTEHQALGNRRVMSRLAILVICITALQAGEIVQHYAFRYPELDNLIFIGEYFISQNLVDSVDLCLIECGKRQDCVTFAFKTNEGKCRLYSTGFYTADMGSTRSNWMFYAYAVPACPAHSGFLWYRTYSMCLHISTIPRTYAVATQYCTERGGRIIPLETTHKQSTISKIIRILNLYSFWLGLNLNGGVWAWTSGQTLANSNWGQFQPTCLPSGSTCLCAISVNSWGWQWNDVLCEGNAKTVCEVVMT